MKTLSQSSSNSNSNNEAASESGAESDALPNFGGMAASTTTTTTTTTTAADGITVGKGTGSDGAEEMDPLDRSGQDVAPDGTLKAGGHEQAINRTGHEDRTGNGDGNGNANGIETTDSRSSRAAAPNDLMRTPSHNHTPTRTASHMGLWGGRVEREMDGPNMPKRRWTVLENAAA